MQYGPSTKGSASSTWNRKELTETLCKYGTIKYYTCCTAQHEDLSGQFKTDLT